MYIEKVFVFASSFSVVSIIVSTRYRIVLSAM